MVVHTYRVRNAGLATRKIVGRAGLLEFLANN